MSCILCGLVSHIALPELDLVSKFSFGIGGLEAYIGERKQGSVRSKRWAGGNSRYNASVRRDSGDGRRA